MLTAFIRKPRLVLPLLRRFVSASDNGFSKDLYKILGVSANADKAQIKSAYASLVKKHHPDVNRSANPETFKDINLAYSVLSNEEKKKEYDGYLEAKSRMGDLNNFNPSSASTSYQSARTYANVCHESPSEARMVGTTPRPRTSPQVTLRSNPQRIIRNACGAGFSSSSTPSNSNQAAMRRTMLEGRFLKKSCDSSGRMKRRCAAIGSLRKRTCTTCKKNSCSIEQRWPNANCLRSSPRSSVCGWSSR